MDNKAQSAEESSSSKLVSGSAWMTAGSISSRILGAVYVIPWVTWMGVYSNVGNALFAKGYNIYNFFLVIATAGIPSAMSKLVAHYNGLNQYRVSQRLYHVSMYFAAGSGIIMAAIMALFAKRLAAGDPNVIPVVRSLAWAVLVIPALSISRGYLQGYNWMAPSAISQFVEQLLRVAYILASTFFVMRIGNHDWVLAVTQSTFAAFIGAFGAIAVIAYAMFSRRKQMREMYERSEPMKDVSTITLLISIIRQSIPFVIVESAITIFQLVDQYTFFPIMHAVGHYTNYQLNVVYALFSFNANKLYMIIISLAMALAVTAIPLLAEARVKNDVAMMRHEIEQSLMLFYFVMIPAALGLTAVAQPIYTVFYRYSQAGTVVLEFAAFVSISLGLYTVVAALMQGISENKKIMKYLFIGLIIKIIIQYPLIYLFRGLGPLLATGLCMLFISICVIHSFNMEFGLHFNQMAKPTNQIMAFSLIMFVCVKIVMSLIGLFVSPYGRYTAFFSLIPGVLVGVLVYGYLVLKSDLGDQFLGPRADVLRQRLHITKR